MSYSAEDFKNARFAEHEDGCYAIRLPDKATVAPWQRTDGRFDSDEDLAGDGWVPVSSRPTLTQSTVKKMVGGYRVDKFAAGFAAGFGRAGGFIIPDPYPTDADRLEKLIDEWREEIDPGVTLAEWLVEYGVTAPREE